MSERQLRGGNWSVQQLERLRQLLPRRGVAATALLLRRTPEAVQRKALQILRVPPRRGAWTDSDDARLRESWGALALSLLAPMLGRPQAEVRRRAEELRRRLRSGPWTRAERQALKDLYGTRTDDDLEVALQRPRAEIAAQARLLCLAKDKRFAAQAAAGEGGAPPPVPRQRMPRWSHAETERLRALYADRDNLAVARELGRTVASIANKANQLGLRKSPSVLAAIGRLNIRVRYDGDAAAAGGAAASV
ncbi:MAG: hypothetical protein KF830_14275 [Planctomycetes bacterium]|nr:hypothetical protein [Planctomycetota bacterium]